MKNDRNYICCWLPSIFVFLFQVMISQLPFRNCPYSILSYVRIRVTSHQPKEGPLLSKAIPWPQWSVQEGHMTQSGYSSARKHLLGPSEKEAFMLFWECCLLEIFSLPTTLTKDKLQGATGSPQQPWGPPAQGWSRYSALSIGEGWKVTGSLLILCHWINFSSWFFTIWTIRKPD